MRRLSDEACGRGVATQRGWGRGTFRPRLHSCDPRQRSADRAVPRTDTCLQADQPPTCNPAGRSPAVASRPLRAAFRGGLLLWLVLSNSVGGQDIEDQLREIAILKKQAGNHASQWRLIADLSEAVLSASPPPPQRDLAVVHRLDALRQLFNRQPDPENAAYAELLEFSSGLTLDSNESIARVARNYVWNLRALRLRAGPVHPDDVSEWVQSTNAILSKPTKDPRADVKLGLLAAGSLERAAFYPEAGQLYERTLQVATAADFNELSENARLGLCRVQMIGKPFVLEAEDVDGHRVSADDLLGRIVLVDFWATYCLPCVKELPSLQEQYSKYHHLGFEVIGVSLDTSDEAVRSFIERRNVQWPVVFDTSAPEFEDHPLVRQFCVEVMPTMFLVDQEGKVVAIVRDAEMLGAELRARLGSPLKSPRRETPSLRKVHPTGLMLRMADSQQLKSAQ